MFVVLVPNAVTRQHPLRAPHGVDRNVQDQSALLYQKQTTK
eukprot:COSAG02_NODE_47557_length_340_cov_0.854772_1_plen_40_part_10